MPDGQAPGEAITGTTVRVGTREFRWQPGAVVTVGRDPGCDVVIDDPEISRQHLRVEAAEDGAWQLRDPGSRNGVFADGRKITAVPLRGDITVRLGGQNGPPLAIGIVPPASKPTDTAAHPAQPPRVQPPPAQPPSPQPPSPQPAPGQPGRLAEKALGRSVSVFVPEADVIRIGRDPSNDIALADDPLASRRHAELRRTASGWEVRDLSSANGTFRNGARVSRAQLADGDLLSTGNHIFVFRAGRLEELSEADDTSLDVAGICVTAPGGGATLLTDVSFSLPSRSMLAVVGPSGAGKSTLLGALTGSLTPSRGQVSFAGRDLHSSYEEFRTRIGLVPQDDLVHAELTPRSEFGLAAALRLPPDTGREGRQARVRQVLAELGLSERADLQISKLSGGQRKRVSVGTELLTQPTLLFLDEPTSGLDPGNEKQVMSVLRQLADGGRVVVVVTHATQSLDLADRVLFLTRGGRVAYFGPPAEALGYFARHGVAGGYADVFRALDEPGDVDWSARFRADPDHERYVGAAVRQAAVRQGAGSRPSTRGASLVPAIDQLRVLINRQLQILRGDRRTMALVAAQPVAFGLIITFLFPKTAISANHGPFAALLLWLLVVSATWLGASGTIREIVKELPIYRRERAVGLSIPAYVGSKFAVFGAITVVQSFIVVALGLSRQTLPPEDPPPHLIADILALGPRTPAASWFEGLRPFGAGSLLGSQEVEIAIAVAIAGLAGVALGLAISALVRKSDQAVFLLPVALVVQMALSLPILKIQNASPIVADVSQITSANWGMNAAASTISLNQVIAPYLFDLNVGEYTIANQLSQAAHAPPPPPGPTHAALITALKGNAAWAHTSGTWLGAVFVTIVITAILLGLTVAALRRLDIRRRPALAQAVR